MDAGDRGAEIRFFPVANLKREDLREFGGRHVAGGVADLGHELVVAKGKGLYVGAHKLLELGFVGLVRDGGFVEIRSVLGEAADDKHSRVVAAEGPPNV